MGVGGLWHLLEPTSSSITLDRLEGKRLAVDISLWLHQAAQGYSSHNLDSKCPHLSLLINRIAKLLFYKIRPVFVFDGAEVPVFKKQLLRNRALKKHLDELISIKHTQTKILEQVVQENRGKALDNLSCLSPNPNSPNKKARKSKEDDIFALPSNYANLLKNDLNESKACTSSSVIPDYLEGFEAMLSADDQMTFLKKAKKKFREARLRIEEIPGESTDFSSFQLKRLLNRNKIHTQMEMLKKEKLAQCVCVSANQMKMLVVDSQLRSHVLLKDDDVQIVHPENIGREKQVKESLTWPHFLKQVEQQKKEEQQSKEQKIIANNRGNSVMDEENDDLQQAILASISEQNALSLNHFKKVPYRFSSADYSKSGVNEDSWTSESENSNETFRTNFSNDLDVTPSSKFSSGNGVEFMSSDSEESDASEEYFPRSSKKNETNKLKEDNDVVYTDCQQFLTLLGLPYMCAPGEAEAQCAELERLNLVDGIISDDSDVWLFGARLVYRNMFSKSKHVQEYNSKKFFEELGLERKEFVQIGILSGGDYTTGFKKVGMVTALELIAEFTKLDGRKDDPMKNAFNLLEKIRDWLKSKSEFCQKNKTGDSQATSNFIESDKRIRLRRIIEKNNDLSVLAKFPNPAIFDAYANPKVDQFSKRFKWKRVDFKKLEDFLQVKMGLSDPQVKKATHGAFEKWDKIMELSTQVYQTRITAFATSNDKQNIGLLSSSQNLEQSAKVQAALSQLKRIKSPIFRRVKGKGEHKKLASDTKKSALKDKNPKDLLAKRGGLQL